MLNDAGNTANITYAAKLCEYGRKFNSSNCVSLGLFFFLIKKKKKTMFKNGKLKNDFADIYFVITF